MKKKEKWVRKRENTEKAEIAILIKL